MDTEFHQLELIFAISFCIAMAIFTLLRGMYPKLWHQMIKRIIEWFEGDR